MQSLISVIIPCYNAGAYIDTSIRSIYEQDYPNIELIIVNDGSTDKSEEQILAWQERFAAKGVSLKYFHQKNKGQAAATSHALKYVTGEYLTLLDADDYFLPGSISKRVQFLDEHPDYAAVRTNGWQIKGEERKLFVTSQKEKDTTDFFYALFFEGATNWAGSYMIRTDVLFDFYPDRNIYPSHFGQNMQIILPVAYKRKFGFIDEPLMVYVLHENSHSQAASPDEQWEKANRNFYGYLDIYRHMIQVIVHDQEERTLYENRINSWQFRHECDCAVREQNKDKLQESFDALCATGYATVNDKITYYAFLSPPKAFVYRICRRMRIRSNHDT